MRIIAGRLKGRTFQSPSGHRTHPMSDKIRGALFNALGELDGLTVLDAFAGTGALSFEAISRGAEHATALDIDRQAAQTIQQNIRELGLNARVKAIRVGASSWLETQSEATFDVVLLDPPYDDVQLATLAQLADRTKPGGVVVVSLPPTQTLDWDKRGYELLTNKSYGDATLWFYRRS